MRRGAVFNEYIVIEMGEALNTRISDGILSEDVETAFLRHATKDKTGSRCEHLDSGGSSAEHCRGLNEMRTRHMSRHLYACLDAIVAVFGVRVGKAVYRFAVNSCRWL
ncbi:MAG: hypothetical protein N2V77_03655 [Canidatus Methanoxibalbensis ujae]|nr:hypothetical protein [Candidatus Methanoxibalbensis ujae]MCW7078840.1 hypothetical protein [Candidatus Methanoxibalbensis ujae]